MPIRRSAAPLALLTALALAGCTAPEPQPTPTAAPTTEPLFASEEEALAAAEEAYRTYLTELDQVSSDGGRDFEKTVVSATREVVDLQRPGFEQLQERALTGSGSRELVSIEIQEIDIYQPRGESFLTAYVCRDISDTDLIDADGRSAVDEKRVTLVALEASFLIEQGTGRVLVAKDEVWSGSSFC